TKDGIKKYAHRVSKSQVFEIKQKPDLTRYLHLVCFVTHRLFELTDIFEKAISACVKSYHNEMNKKAKEEHLKNADQQSENTQKLVDESEGLMEALTIIANAKGTLKDNSYTDKQKISKALRILSKASLEKDSIETTIEAVKTDLKQTFSALFLMYLEESAAKLHLRCKDMVVRLAFDPESSNKPLLRTINKFQSSAGKINEKFPTSHLTPKEVTNLYKDMTFSANLYKVYFYKHIADSFKSDSLNLLYSYTNRRFDEYWISKRRWNAEYVEILTQLGMEATLDFDSYLDDLARKTDAQFHETNDHILNNDNPYVLIDYEGGYTTTAQKKNIADDIELNTDEIEALYKLDRPVTLTEAIATVNRACGFLQEFQHFNNNTNLKRPDDSVFIAGLIGHGQHIGLRKLAKHAPDINLNTLERASNAYFNLENLLRVNDRILKFVDNMPLANRFKTEFGLQTSSDGQKWIVTKDSYNASPSFKYGGKDFVLSEYNFIDCRGLFLHSDVFSGAEKEAHYLIDGLAKNEVVRSELHSSDTHGYTEAVFGISHLLGFSFAPRIKNIHKQQLYGAKVRSYYARKGYQVLPKQKTGFDKIRKHKDDILRMVASIGIGEVTASQIFRKLNSYAEVNNELYDAIKEFGRIIKTIFILRYIDNQELREAIQKQLNKGENGNKMDRALILGRMEYNIAEPADQEIAECCKKILKNIMVCWNYMYLTQKLDSASSFTEKARILDNIDGSLVLTWSHFLTHGKFEFSNRQLEDSMNFDFNKMHDPSVIELFDFSIDH
ncbi:MAG: Tn3 family transposase, partial [Pseudomonadales bacterium]|nr:Tn3 family transposase [Pseudomonadales bacterium]